MNKASFGEKNNNPRQTNENSAIEKNLPCVNKAENI